MKDIFGLHIPETLEEVCDPQRVALLVCDMQVGILSQIKNPEQITLQVLKVLTAARDAGVRVLFSRYLSLPKELMGTFQFRTAMAWQRVNSPEQVNPWFLRDNRGFQIAPELLPLPQGRYFRQVYDVGLRKHMARHCFVRLRHRFLYHRWGCHRNRHRADRPSRCRPWLHPSVRQRRLRHRRRRSCQTVRRKLEVYGRRPGDRHRNDIRHFATGTVKHKTRACS